MKFFDMDSKARSPQEPCRFLCARIFLRRNRFAVFLLAHSLPAFSSAGMRRQAAFAKTIVYVILSEMLDVALSLKIAREIEVVKKACWRNAFLAFVSCEELHDGWYIEGWAIPGKEFRVNLEHAWIQRPDGSIVDPTWAWLGHRDPQYFPAARYTHAQAIQVYERKKSVKFPLTDNVNRLRHPAYLHAYKASFQAAFGKPIPSRKG